VAAEVDTRWRELFAEEAALVRSALGGRVVTVEHVGSTAVPGLAGKPVVDLLVGLAAPLTGADNRALKRLGYVHLRARRDGRLVFRKGTPCRYSLHVTDYESERWRAALAFRDYLRASPEAAEQYAQLKAVLSEKRRFGYSAGKSAFISQALQRATFETGPLERIWSTPGVEPSEN